MEGGTELPDGLGGAVGPGAVGEQDGGDAGGAVAVGEVADDHGCLVVEGVDALDAGVAGEVALEVVAEERVEGLSDVCGYRN